MSIEPTIEQMDSIHNAGGIIGQAVGGGWYQMLNLQGATLVLIAMFLVGVTWLTGLSWLQAVDALGFYVLQLSKKLMFLGSKVVHLGELNIDPKQKRE